MAQREINQMLSSSLQNLNLLVDSSKVVGTPLHIDEERIIIPLSKITFGFGVGGSEFSTEKGQIINNNNLLENNDNYPFGGGTLGGVNISPIAFLMIEKDSSRIIRVEQGDTLFDKLIDIFIAFMNKNHKKE